MEEKKILVVDDDPDVLDLLEETLEGKFIVLKADNGYSALSKTKQEHPDVIIMDIMLPRLDGYQTCVRLKDSPETKNIPILIISAHTNKEIVLKLLKLGIKDYLAKPFDVDELVKRIDQMYQNFKSEHQINSNLNINMKITENILTVALTGDYEKTDNSLIVQEVEKKLTSEISKVIFNINGIKLFGLEQVNYFKDISEYLQKRNKKIKINAGDTRSLRVNLIKNSDLGDMLVSY
ncbi:MAG: response regulator [Spirochaetes bacterium]|nr:response regulator [Spirochaetota bacterium]